MIAFVSTHLTTALASFAVYEVVEVTYILVLETHAPSV